MGNNPAELSYSLAWTGGLDFDFHNLLFHGKVDQITLRRKSYFSDTLVIAGFGAQEAAKIADLEKFDAVKQTLRLRGLNLEGAVFLNADLPQG